MQEKQNLAFSDQLITERKVYVAPEFSVMEIEMEQGIAAGSGSVVPTDNVDSTLGTEWQGGSDEETINV
ncbi:hypothetical protein [Elizabethkingia ursingii]|uniref:Uncharacterized protein n=1 Tax=Elizabethkingia ursingii TaxID=1756150 RepID=A0ABX3NAK8_9FLAO|nr:hypothetical protein [Elizabethkingia ursingii]OPB88541.1 hypothetical protein BB021_08330 [Elizabethkingia ursingii]